MHYVSTNVFPISGERAERARGRREIISGEKRELKSTDAGLLDITEAEASVDCWAAVPHLVGVEVDPDGEGPDEAVDGAVAGPVAGALRHRAEHRAAQPLCPTAASQLGRGQTRGNIL